MKKKITAVALVIAILAIGVIGGTLAYFTDTTEAVANEISMNLEALVGTTDEPAPKVVPHHPTSDTTSKFANLQFGRNYDPTHK